MTKDIQRWADSAMYSAEEMPGKDPDNVGVITPQVHLVSMTPDPLGEIASACMMYEGRVARSKADVTHEDRKRFWEQIQKTHLKAPLEFVHLHFLLEGVTRSFTHQLVRQRTAVYAQESLRFAVKEDLDEEVALPPSLAGRPADDPLRKIWQRTVNVTDDAYSALVAAGIPAEDARGLLPHNVTTRVHYATNLRNLLEHSGNRLCTQAQFEWRLVFASIAQVIRNYRPSKAMQQQAKSLGDENGVALLAFLDDSDAWQYQLIADALRPICYQLGGCQFKADFDRKCSIRDRVETNARHGIPSSEWGLGHYGDSEHGGPWDVEPIEPIEWLGDPTAAR